MPIVMKLLRNNINNVSKSSSENETKKEENKSNLTKVAAGVSLAGLTALASYGIYKVATRGKGNANIQKAIQEFKTKFDTFADKEPIITKLKNGKTKIEFKNFDERMARQENYMIVLNKKGEFDKLIKFNDYGENFKEYLVYNEYNTAKPVKYFKSIRKTVNEEGIDLKHHEITIRNLKDADSYSYSTQHIETAKSKNFAGTRRFNEEQSDIRIHTVANKKDKIVRQTTYNEETGERVTTYFKPGKQKQILDKNTKLAITDEDNKEFFTVFANS